MIYIPRRKTNEEYRLELKKRFPNIKHIGEYVNGRTKTKYHCKICGHIWDSTPDNLKVTKHGCPKCARQHIIATHTYSRDYFLTKMKELHPNIKILGQYKDMNTKIQCKCLIDGYIWDLKPSYAINRKHGCPKCGGSLRLTNEQFVGRLKNEHPHIIALSEYINDNTKVKLKCLICGNEWEASPTHLHQGRGCPKCRMLNLHNQFAKTEKAFISEMQSIDPTIEIIGDYYNSHTKIKCRCRKCGNEWLSLPNNLLKKRGCSNCSASKGERQISYWLDYHDIKYYTEYHFEDCKYHRSLPFDFYLPDLNICIEYDGIQHYQPVQFGNMTKVDAQEAFKQCQIRDQIKNNYCKNNNITLYRIPYWDYDNISQIIEKLLF